MELEVVLDLLRCGDEHGCLLLPCFVIGTTLAQPSFYVYMHLLNKQGESTAKTVSLIGAMSGVSRLAESLGS